MTRGVRCGDGAGSCDTAPAAITDRLATAVATVPRTGVATVAVVCSMRPPWDDIFAWHCARSDLWPVSEAGAAALDTRVRRGDGKSSSDSSSPSEKSDSDAEDASPRGWRGRFFAGPLLPADLEGRFRFDGAGV